MHTYIVYGARVNEKENRLQLHVGQYTQRRRSRKTITATMYTDGPLKDLPNPRSDYTI